MKKATLAILGTVILCSMGVILALPNVNAYKAGYLIGNYQGADITADGTVAASEWTDAYQDFLYNGWTKTTDTFSTKWEMGGTPTIADQWLIEVLSCTTSNAGDVFTFCFCGAADDSATPQAADDVLVNVTHTSTTIYRGTGSGWAPDPSIVLGTNVVVGQSMAASAASSTPHWIIELKFDKSGGIVGTSFDSNDRLQVYVASTGQTLMWPPMSQQDVPSSYGQLNYSNFAGQSIPEGLTVGVMLVLSTVAVAVSIRYFRKPPKI